MKNKKLHCVGAPGPRLGQRLFGEAGHNHVHRAVLRRINHFRVHGTKMIDTSSRFISNISGPLASVTSGRFASILSGRVVSTVSGRFISVMRGRLVCPLRRPGCSASMVSGWSIAPVLQVLCQLLQAVAGAASRRAVAHRHGVKGPRRD